MGLCTSQNSKSEGGQKPDDKKQTPAPEEPKTEEAKAEPKAEEAKTEPKAEEPKAEEAKVEPAAAAAVEPKTEEAKVEPVAAAAVEPKTEEPKAEEAKAEPVAAVEEPKAEEPKAEEAKAEPVAAVEEPKAEEPKAEEPKAEVEAVAVVAVVAVVPATESSGDLPPYTNRPEELEGYTVATGTYTKRQYEVGVTPDCSALPELTGEFVTDGKVSFDKAALSIEGVYPTRDEEVAAQQKAIEMKKDASAATAKANELHEEANKLYEAGDKDGNKAKIAESKEFRTKAQEIHQESFDIAYACAMSQAFKALYSKYPSVDFHVFLVDPYEKSAPVVIDMMKKYQRFGRKDFLVIPGEGQHSGPSGPKIPPHWAQYMVDHAIVNEQITSGSFAIQLDSVKAL